MTDFDTIDLRDVYAKIRHTPCWYNLQGYRSVKNDAESKKAGKAIYDFWLEIEAPLTFYDGEYYYQPNRHYLTDGVSTPHILQACTFFASDTFLVSGYLHDSSYAFQGMHRCKYVNGLYEFVAMTREQCDELLYKMVCAEIKAWPANTWWQRFKRDTSYNCAWLYWAGVRMGGGWNYGKGDVKSGRGKPLSGARVAK